VSGIAKVLTVVIFALSIVFCVVSGELFVKKDKLSAEYDKYKKEAEAKISENKRQIEGLQSTLVQLKQQVAEQAQRIAVVEKERDAAREQAKQQTLLANAASQEKAKLMTLYEALGKKVDEWVKKADAVEAENKKLTAQVAQLQQTIRDKETEVKKVADQLKVKTDQVASLEATVSDLKRRLESKATGGGEGAEYQPPIDAKVIEVDPDLNLVVINKGRKHDVGIGYVFTVYRGDQYVGDLRIDSVQDEIAGGSPVPGTLLTSIRKGDSASTRIR